MTDCFDPVLEYRKYIQKDRTQSQKQNRLAKLALKAQVTVKYILTGYAEGLDILDPEIFEKEAIIEFAEANGIQNDPQVKRAINAAKPALIWGL